MFEGGVHNGLMAKGTQRVYSTLSRAFVAINRLAVLLLLAVGQSVAYAQDDERTGLRRFDFVGEVQLPMGRGRVEGAMASDGSRQRITIYWTTPDVFREATPFIRFVDVIFTAEAVHYWIYPGMQHGVASRRGDSDEPLLPPGQSLDSVVRSALALIRRMGLQNEGQDSPLEVGRFFLGSRRLPESVYKSQSNDGAINEPTMVADRDLQSLNSWPAGREYSKECQEDGVVLWRVKRALLNTLVSVVTIKPATPVPTAEGGRLFDVATLGESMLVPEAYRAYWSFDRALLELTESPDRPAAARALCARFESCLNDSNAPLEVRRGMCRLWFKAAMVTDDPSCICAAVQGAVMGVREDTPFGCYRGLLELARCSGKIQIQSPQDPQEWLRPLVGEMVKRAGPEVEYCFTRLMPLIDMNRWFIFGEFLLDEIRSQDLLGKEALRDIAVRFEATRSAGQRHAPDPCEPSPRVREYLARIDDEPLQGSLDLETVRHILEEGLAAAYAGTDPRMKQSLVDEVMRSLRLIAGEGPFRGDAERLPQAIERFSERFQKVYGSGESMGPILVTFLGLSFCDLSTAEDHDVLFAQLAGQSAELQSQVNAALREQGLDAVMTPQEVADTFGKYTQSFAEYVQDPLWPTHKFPLAKGEQTVLAGRLAVSLLEQRPLLDDVALKVKYGGTNAELKNALIRGVSHVARQLMSETGFIRRPPYPGVLCDYQSTLGFTAMIEGPFYEEGKRPKEKFRAMKYFHLGHRLQEVVEWECALARHEQLQEHTQ